MKETLLFSLSISLVSLFLLVSCGGGVTGPTDPGNDPNFTIVAHLDAGFTSTNRKVEILGVPIYAYANVEDVKLLHAANIMAQYLDNDEDGVVDNPALLSALISSNAALYMWKQEGQQGSINAQDLGADESVPAWHNNGHTGRFDAALEEIWHVITHSGFANAYPDAFGEDAGTSLTNAMATEYIYWAMTSVLGAQGNRAGEIQQEWKLNTKAKVQQMDTAIYQLLTDPQYVFPTVLPDGTYRR
jgi:hypothetical protein